MPIDLSPDKCTVPLTEMLFEGENHFLFAI
jgi:hypothetical protein